MRYETFPNSFFIENRKKLISQLLPNSVVILTSNDILPSNADGTLPFKQHSELFYLTGIDQEETYLLLYPEAKKSTWKEILFIKETNAHIQIWEGKKLSKSEATQISGIEQVYWSRDFFNILQQLVFEAENIYMTTNEHTRAHITIKTANDRLLETVKQTYPLHTYKRLSPFLTAFRMIKSETEIKYIQKAIDITKEAFIRVLKLVKPGLYEYQVEAEITHTFLWHGASGHAYAPIIASGADSCVLHYVKNDKILQEGDVLLLDFGACYGNYNADLTRTIPVSGRFSARQKAVYNEVLHIQRSAKKKLIPGTTLDSYHEQMGEIVTESLLKLGLLDEETIKKQDPKKPAYKTYFMHGVSHHLGLDVHDVYIRTSPLANNMILTCEPGIYIPNEKIGVRLENNICVQNNNPVDLMSTIPIEVEEIEDMMLSSYLKTL